MDSSDSCEPGTVRSLQRRQVLPSQFSNFSCNYNPALNGSEDSISARKCKFISLGCVANLLSSPQTKGFNLSEGNSISHAIQNIRMESGAMIKARTSSGCRCQAVFNLRRAFFQNAGFLARSHCPALKTHLRTTHITPLQCRY